MAALSTQARIVRLSVTEGALATVMGSLTSGVFLTGYAIALGASRFQIGILAALPTLANIAQLGGSFILERRPCNKALCVGALLASRLLWLPIVASPWLFPDGTAVPWLISLVGFSCILNSVGGVAWLAWIRGLIPTSERVRFLGVRYAFNTGLSMTLCVVGGLLVEGWSRQHLDTSQGFLAAFALAAVAGLFGIGFMAAIPDASNHLPGMPRFRSLLAALAKERNFRRLVAFYSVWQFSAQMATPFFAVYMLQRLGMPFWFVTMVTVLASLCGIWATSFWTRLAQRFGTKPTVWAATAADAFVPLAWLFVEQPWSWTVLLIHLSGLLNAPLIVGPNELVLKLAPEKNGTPYIATFNAIVGPIAGLAAVVGGYLAGTFGSYSIAWGPFTFEGLKFVFLLSFVGRLLSLLILRGVHEPNCEPVVHVLRVLNRARRRRIARKPAALRPAA